MSIYLFRNTSSIFSSGSILFHLHHSAKPLRSLFHLLCDQSQMEGSRMMVFSRSL